MVGAHVDEFVRFPDQLEGALEHRLRLADKSDHRAVGFLPGIDIEQLDTCDRRRGLGHRVVDLGIATFGNIGDALNDLHRILPETASCRPPGL